MAVYKTKKPTKDGREYYFRIKYKDILGNVHDYSSPKYKLRKEAENEEAKYRVKVMNNETLLENLTLQQVYVKYRLYKENTLKKQTMTKLDNQFEHLKDIHNIKINDLKYSHIELLKKSLDKKDFSVEYKNKIIRLLINIVKFSNKYYNTSLEILKFCDPYKNKELKKEMEFFTFEEYKQFDNVIDEFAWHTFFEILYFMGLRQGELQALQFKDINFKKQEISISKTLTTKLKGEKWTISPPKTKNSIRVLPIPIIVLNDLKMLLNEASKFRDYKDTWFVFGNSMPFKETTIQTHKNKYCKLAGVKQIRIHDFRHSCASLLINRGASIQLVSKYLGHANISITLKIYTHLYKSELDSVVNLLDKL